MPPHLKPASILHRVVTALAVLGAVLLVPLPAAGGWVWDAAQLAGYAALLLAVLLFVYPLRPSAASQGRSLSISLHRRLGWWALGLALAHAAVLLIREPLTVHYLPAAAPLYMLCGTVGLIALAVLVWSGLTVRTGLRPKRRTGVHRANPAPRAALLHGVLSALLLGLLGAHLAGSGQFIAEPAKRVTMSLELALPMLYWVWGLAARKGGPGVRLVPVVAALTGICLLALPTQPARSRLLEPSLARPERLAIDFPHDRHRSVSCVTCHHNFLDATGTGSCLDCHRSPRNDLNHSSEATFHVFCRDCHARLARVSDKHGPTRACSGCHTG